jgi:RNA polymerase sigma factor (sigma-70 family)
MNQVTSASLLEKVRDVGDEAAWWRFYAFYAPLIVGFCLRRGCSHAMAQDVLQETMGILLRKMPSFTYDPNRRFRSYLLRIVDRCRLRAWKRQERYLTLETGSKAAWVDQIADPRALSAPAEWDALCDRRLLAGALERVRQRVSQPVYRSFELSTICGLSVGEVMAELGIPNANTVYQHRNRVMRYLLEAAEELRREMDI